MEEELCCRNCQFWDRYGDQSEDPEDRLPEGQCRRMPPTVIHSMLVDRSAVCSEGLYRGLWPDTFSEDWCGEHKPKETV